MQTELRKTRKAISARTRESPEMVETLTSRKTRTTQERNGTILIVVTVTARVELINQDGPMAKVKITNRAAIKLVEIPVRNVTTAMEEIASLGTARARLGWTLEAPAIKLVGADGKPLGLRGTTVLDLELRFRNVSKKLKHRVAVIENLTAPMLIGLELMKELQIFIDVPNWS